MSAVCKRLPHYRSAVRAQAGELLRAPDELWRLAPRDDFVAQARKKLFRSFREQKNGGQSVDACVALKDSDQRFSAAPIPVRLVDNKGPQQAVRLMDLKTDYPFRLAGSTTAPEMLKPARRKVGSGQPRRGQKLYCCFSRRRLIYLH